MKKTVPQYWYKEMANEMASECIKKGGAYGIESNEYLTAKKKYDEFKRNFRPSEEIKNGNLDAAKDYVLHRENLIRQITSIDDENDPYRLIGACSDMFFLSNKQTGRLMSFMSRKNLLY